jgi:hypothetical protein
VQSYDVASSIHPSLEVGRCDARAVRHCGLFASVLIAALVMAVRSPHRKRLEGGRWGGGMQLAAAVTALEALASDLLRFTPGAGAAVAAGGGGGVCLFCGNFGIVLINFAWAAGGSRGALDILEKMVEVTMMRGGVAVAHAPTDGAPTKIEGVRHVIHLA